MFDFQENRLLMVDNLHSIKRTLVVLGVENELALLCDTLEGNFPRTNEVCRDGQWLCGPFETPLETLRNFVRTIAVSESNPKKPAHAKPSVWGSYDDCTASENRVAVRWATLLKLMKRYGVLPEKFNVERAAEQIGQYWPSEEEFTFEVSSDVYDTYQLAQFGSCMYQKEFTRWYDATPDTVKIV